MAFNTNDVQEDVNFTGDSDPMLRRTASAPVLQDLKLSTYWANTVGKTKYPGVYQMYKKELKQNLEALLDTDMTYRDIEGYMNMLGYDSDDVRACFTKVTGVDPVKLEFMRLEDIKKVPANIPGFNLGWGPGKRGAESYFVMQDGRGLFVIYAQKSDTEREEVKSFLNRNDAMKHLSGLVKEVHRYDLPAKEAAEEMPELDMEEPTSKFYTAIANRLYDMEKKGMLCNEHVFAAARDAVTCGNLTVAEGEYLIKKYAADAPLPAEDLNVAPAHVDESETPTNDMESKELRKEQENSSVRREVEKRTPQDFFRAMLPNRLEEIATEHIEDVLSYIANRESDIDNFGINLHSLQYRKNDEGPKTVGEINPQTGEPSGPPRATISAILEVENKVMPTDNNKKFVLAVFFVNPNGQISTSDSVKGEDDIIYGFTQEGLEQYFSKNMKPKA